MELQMSMSTMLGAGSVVVPIVIALVVILLGGAAMVLLRGSQPKAIGTDGDDQEGAEALAPRIDVLDDRREVDGPIEITDQMSLREIKEAKRSRLSMEYKASDEDVEREKTRRRTGGSLEVDADLARELSEEASADVIATPTEPAASGSASTISQAAATAVLDAKSVPSAPTTPDASLTDASVTKEAVAGPAAAKLSLSKPAVSKPAATAETRPTSAPTAEAKEAQADGSVGVPTESTTAGAATGAATAQATTADAVTASPATKPSADERSLRDGLAKTRGGFVAKLGSLFSKSAKLDEDLEDEIEEVLLTSDIGVHTAMRLMDTLRDRYEEAAGSQERVWAILREETEAILEPSKQQRFTVDRSVKPYVVLVVGVNGAGKTTSIGKMAARLKAAGLKPMMVAGDTFRAAAVEQLQEWGTRVGCPVHRGNDKADPSAVVFDGIRAAEAAGVDVVLCDTAGRLHTKAPLIDELKKVRRVCDKAMPGAPHEVILVLDANTGQNAIQQATLFGEAVDVSGIVLTKLDGTAKGGVVIGISAQLSLPIYFIGIGEGIADLRRFDASEFVDALY